MLLSPGPGTTNAAGVTNRQERLVSVVYEAITSATFPGGELVQVLATAAQPSPWSTSRSSSSPRPSTSFELPDSSSPRPPEARSSSRSRCGLLWLSLSLQPKTDSCDSRRQTATRPRTASSGALDFFFFCFRVLLCLVCARALLCLWSLRTLAGGVEQVPVWTGSAPAPGGAHSDYILTVNIH